VKTHFKEHPLLLLQIINITIMMMMIIIIIKNKKEKTCTPIDVAIPTDRNVVQKEAEKKLKYKSLRV